VRLQVAVNTSLWLNRIGFRVSFSFFPRRQWRMIAAKVDFCGVMRPGDEDLGSLHWCILVFFVRFVATL
jgi:hypothetical protein